MHVLVYNYGYVEFVYSDGLLICAHVYSSILCLHVFLYLFQLMVEPMMEVPPDVPEGWGFWDDEIADRSVTYMAGRLSSSNNFLTTDWRGGDDKEVLYCHEKAKEVRKRKRVAPGPKTEAPAGPLLKQRRLSAYFKKPAVGHAVNDLEVLNRIAALERTVEWMKRRLAKRRKVSVTPRKELLRSTKKFNRKKKELGKGSKDVVVSEEEEQQHGPGLFDDSFGRGKEG